MKHGIRGANLKHENMPMKDIEMWPEGFLFLWPKASLTGCNYEAVRNKTSNSAAFYHRPIGTYRSCQGFLGSIWIWHRDAFLLLSLTPTGQRCFQLLVNHYFAQILGIAAQIPADKPDDKYAIWIWGGEPVQRCVLAVRRAGTAHTNHRLMSPCLIPVCSAAHPLVKTCPGPRGPIGDELPRGQEVTRGVPASVKWSPCRHKCYPHTNVSPLVV